MNSLKSNYTDSFRTLKTNSPEVLLKDRKSKFYGCAFPINSEDEVKPYLEMLKKKHATANHVCYAWQVGTDTIRYRANDDGEPNNSAGIPIYGQIQSFQLTNVLVTVTRIFGGTKLGVGGLIHAYREASRMALETSDIIEKTIETVYEVGFEYANMNKVMRIIKMHQLTIASQKLEVRCTIVIKVRKGISKKIAQTFKTIPGIVLKELV